MVGLAEVVLLGLILAGAQVLADIENVGLGCGCIMIVFDILSLQPLPADVISLIVYVESTLPVLLYIIPVGFCEVDVCPLPKSQ